MTQANERLREAVQEAARPGDAAAPAELVALLARTEQPLQALQDQNQFHELLAAFNKDFGFVHFSFQQTRARSPLSMDENQRQRYASLLRWVTAELCGWRRGEDLRFEKLTAVFLACQVCDIGNGLWALLPDDSGASADLVAYLKQLIASFDVSFSAHGVSPPLWESEMVETFKKADAAGDWPAIIDAWQRFPLVFGNALQTQAVRFLYRYDPQNLAGYLATLRRTAVAMQVAGILTTEQSLGLAGASDNPYFQIAAAYRALTDIRRSPNIILTSESQERLTNLLVKVAQDVPRWNAWMRAFNTYPSRFPALQRPLGKALASAPHSALADYVAAVWLFPQPFGQQQPGRRAIAECLGEFSADASSDQRSALWKLAYRRWRDWDFNKADTHQHLTAINGSCLDYALVAYAMECMDEPARNNAMQALRTEILSLEHIWHASHSDIITSWNRLLSRFQPYAHAATLAKNGGDWLAETRTYLPFEPSQNPYLMSMYRAV